MPKLSIFERQNKNQSQTGKMVEYIGGMLAGSKYSNPGMVKSLLSLESLDDGARDEVYRSSSDLEKGLENIRLELGLEDLISDYQLAAGTYAGMYATNPRALYTSPRKALAQSELSPINIAVEDAFDERPSAYSMEAYDERNNELAQNFSIVYNIHASQQDEFGETWYPTIVIPPDHVGYNVTISLLTVFDGFKRGITGALTDYQKKNVLRAFADPTILKNDMTKIVPVYRAQAADNFVDQNLIAAYDTVRDGETIHTAPLAIGKSIDLLSISQTDAMLANAASDQTDSIDTALEIGRVFVKFTSGQNTDIVVFPIKTLPGAVYQKYPSGNYRRMIVAFETSSLTITKDTKTFGTTDLTTMTAIAQQNLFLTFKMDLNGQVNIEKGDCKLDGSIGGIFALKDANDDDVSLSAGVGATLAGIINSAEILGYDIEAYRTNANRRERGQLIDRTQTTQPYTVRLRSPITALHPVNADPSMDSTDLDNLITVTRIRTSNAAVDALFQAKEVLAAYTDIRDNTGEGPEVFGGGRYYVRPTYIPKSFDLRTIVDSLTSTSRAEDIQNALINQIRIMAYELWRRSEYKAAMEALNGGVNGMPKIIIGTDTVLSQFLMITGDNRTVGPRFNYRVVDTLNKRMTGKIFISFGVFDDNRNAQPNMLNWGNMLWSPELTLVMPISRDNQVSKELTVQPRFLHINNLPILGYMEVTGLEEVNAKIAIDINGSVNGNLTLTSPAP